MEEIKVEKIKTQDIPEVKELLDETWRYTYGKYYQAQSADRIIAGIHDAKMLKEQAEQSNIYFAVAKNKTGKIVGTITVRKVDGITVFMNRLYVHPDFQGQGIGKRLLTAAFEFFPEAKKIRVECEKKNGSGCGFYLKQGFEIIGEKDEVVEGVNSTAVEFEKEIVRQ